MNKKIEVEIPDGFHLEPTENGYKLVKDVPTLTEILRICGYSPRQIEIRFPHFPGSLNNSDRLKILGQLMCVADYLNDGWMPNWTNFKEQKYSFFYDYDDKQFHIGHNYSSSICFVYFKSEELAEKAIKIIGEETLKVLF